jgi:hypothetical protein
MSGYICIINSGGDKNLYSISCIGSLEVAKIKSTINNPNAHIIMSRCVTHYRTIYEKICSKFVSSKLKGLSSWHKINDIESIMNDVNILCKDNITKIYHEYTISNCRDIDNPFAIFDDDIDDDIDNNGDSNRHRISRYHANRVLLVEYMNAIDIGKDSTNDTEGAHIARKYMEHIGERYIKNGFADVDSHRALVEYIRSDFDGISCDKFNTHTES